MFRRVIIVTTLLLTMTVSILFVEVVLAQPADSWQVSYWNNTGLAGAPVVVASELLLDHDWGGGAPPGVAPDLFSARWTRILTLPAGTYRFTAVVDDGVRVWIDGQLSIDAWKTQMATAYSATRTLAPGLHSIVVEYFEHVGLASIRFTWEQVTVPPPVDGEWQAAYWNNTTLAGAPALQRTERVIHHDWGAGAPPGISADGFSARWSRTVELEAGTYRFTATSDDGIRVFVDGQLLISDWNVRPVRSVVVEKEMSAGGHLIVVEYFENLGAARVAFEYTLAVDPIDGWQAEYFPNTSLDSLPVLVRSEPQLGFELGPGSPVPGVVAADFFSVRWTDTVFLEPGRYRFTMIVDDGGRLWVHSHLLIDAWREQAATNYTADLYVAGGQVPIRMEYFEAGNQAVARLFWQRIDPPPDVAVTVQDGLDLAGH